MGFVVWVLRWRNHRHHSCFTIAAQRVFKYSCKFAISVRYVVCFTLLIGKSFNNISESWKRLVNLLAFFKSFAGCASYIYSFWACKVDKIEFANSDLFTGCAHLLDDDYKNSVGPRTHIVHSCARLDPRLLALQHQVVDLGRISNCPLWETLHKNASFWFWVFSNL